MTATYTLEALDDGMWEKVHESSDPFSIIQKSIELSAQECSMRTTVVHDHDPLKESTHDLFGRKLNPEITAALAEFDKDPAADITISSLRVDPNATTQKHEIKPNPPKPTVGRIVLYQSGDQTLAAIITQVGLLQHESRTPDVKLHIFWPDDAASMPNGGWHVFSEELKGGYWSWPQRG